MTAQLVIPGTEDPDLPRDTDEAVNQAREIIQRAMADEKPTRRFLLFSGGNDSLVTLDVMAPFVDEIIHVVTGIGIPETTAFAQRVAAEYDLPYRELHPPEPYETFVLRPPIPEKKLHGWDGMPGPGIHYLTYQRLKERPLEALLREHRKFRGERFALLTGVRRAESKRRMGYKDPINRKGGQVWVNPLLHWPNRMMQDYRDGQSLAINEVSACLHMSGECLCGAMADQRDDRSEREAIRFFYPGWEKERLTPLENECHRRGLTYREWGVKRPDDDREAGPMCQSCEFRQLSFDESTDESTSPVVVG